MDRDNLSGRQLILSDEFFSVPASFLKLIGVQLVRVDGHIRFTYNYFAYFQFVNMVIHLGLAIIQLYVVTRRSQFDVFEFVLILAAIFYWFVSLSKVFVFLNPGFFNLFDFMEEMYPKTLKLQTEYNIEKCLRQTKRIMWVYSTFYFVMASLFGILPNLQNFLETGRLNVKFALSIWYPFDAHDPLLLPFIYLLQNMGALTGTILTSTGDILLFAFVNQLCEHFNYWKRFLKEGKTTKNHSHNCNAAIETFVQNHISIVQ